MMTTSVVLDVFREVLAITHFIALPLLHYSTRSRIKKFEKSSKGGTEISKVGEAYSYIKLKVLNFETTEVLVFYGLR